MDKKLNNKLLEKSVDVEPVGVIYSLSSSKVEDFVYNLLVNKFDVDKVNLVKCIVSGNKSRPEVQIGVFIDKYSADINTNRNNDIPDFIRKKLESGAAYPSQKLKQAVSALTPEIELKMSGNQVVIILDIFRVLGLMLMANPKFHNINIVEADRVKGESVMIVYKTIKSNDFGGNDNDSAAKTLLKLSKRY